MEQTLQLNGEPTPKSVKIRQNIAAGLLVFTDIYWLISLVLMRGGVYLGTLFPENEIIGLICIIAWGLLCSTASNKAARIASVIILICIFSKFIVGLLTGDYIVLYTYGIVRSLSMIYAYSLIINSGSGISQSDRSWLGVLIVLSISYALVYLFWIILGKYINAPQYNFTASVGWVIWQIANYILLACAEFRVAKCAAFKGNYNPEPAPKGTYLPFNKYFAAAFIAIPITLGLLWIVYSNIDSIESLF